MYLPISFFLNFYMSILLDLGVSLAQLCLPAYTKLQSINLDLGLRPETSAFKCPLTYKKKVAIF